MKKKCYYCNELKTCQHILGKDNELKAGYMTKEPRKRVAVCKECIKKQGGIARIAESL